LSGREKELMPFDKKNRRIYILLISGCVFFLSCGVIKSTYNVAKGTAESTYDVTKTTVKTTYKVAKGTVKTTYKVTKFAGKTVYQIGKYTFIVIMAPLSWPLTHEEIASIDDLPPKEAIRQGRVKASPYVVRGKRYVPMSVKEAGKYRETGIASWYGYETLHQKGGHMTANGEVFDPNGLNAAHKYLPLPTYVRVTNLENHRDIIVRVNDRGPFVQGRIIDLSAGAAKKLGFYKKGTARVLVETIQLKG
jgi:peptidoglycan lytic transglycosylase